MESNFGRRYRITHRALLNKMRHTRSKEERDDTILKALAGNPADIPHLDAAILDTEFNQPQMADFPISHLLDHVTALLAPMAAEKDIHLAVVPTSATVHSNRDLLGQILRNLIDNAIRYTNDGRVLVDCLQRADRLRIEVRDTGIGIPPGQIERIRDALHQDADLQLNDLQDSGIQDRDRGLAKVSRISWLLGHPIDVASVLGEGSTFTIEVPLETPHVTVMTAAETVAPPALQASGAGKVVVVIEDDAMILMGLQAGLRRRGYKVVVAASADQALARLRAADLKPDVIVADYWLSGGQVGTEAILKIRKIVSCKVPGIILTGMSRPEIRQDATAHGFGLIYKPVTPQQLHIAINRQIAGAGDAAADQNGFRPGIQ